MIDRGTQIAIELSNTPSTKHGDVIQGYLDMAYAEGRADEKKAVIKQIIETIQK